MATATIATPKPFPFSPSALDITRLYRARVSAADWHGTEVTAFVQAANHNPGPLLAVRARHSADHLGGRAMSNSKKKSVTLKHAKKRAVTTPTAKVPSGDEALLANVGAELRSIVLHLGLVESYVIVAELALDGQDAEQDCEIATLLQRGRRSALQLNTRSREGFVRTPQ
jgi:hypothetical protein